MPLTPVATRELDLLPFVSGTVVDKQQRPLSDVAIVARCGRRERETLDDEAFEHDALARSDTSGRFAIRELPPRTVALVAGRAGFAPTEWHEFAVDPAENQGIVLVLRAGGSIAGRVVDSSGRAISHASVTWDATARQQEWIVAAHLPDEPLCSIVPAEQRLTRTTCANGHVRFDRIHRAAGRLVVAAWGYAGQELEIEHKLVAEFCADGLAATGEHRRDPATVVLTREDVLFDVLAAESGRPLLDASIVILEGESSTAVGWLPPWNSGPSGSTFVPWLDRRRESPHLRWRYAEFDDSLTLARMLGEAPHARSFVAMANASGRTVQPLPFTLEPGREPPRIEFRLALGEEPPVLSGRIVGASCATIELRPLLTGASLATDMRYWHSGLATATTDDAREFAIRGVPSVRCMLDAIAPLCAPIRREFELPLTGMVLEFVPEARIEGTLLDRGDAPVADVVVELQTAKPGRAWQCKTRTDGSFAFPLLARGPTASAPSRRKTRPATAAGSGA